MEHVVQKIYTKSSPLIKCIRS